MKLRCGLVALLLFALAGTERASTEGSPLRFTLNVDDVVVGELPLGAYSLFSLIVENSSSEDVRLGTGGNTAWLVRSPYWELHIEGPRVPECTDLGDFDADEMAGVGEVPSIRIPANSTRQYPLILTGVCNPGVFRVSVKYNGTRVPHETCYRGDVRSEEFTFEITEAQGVDAEIVDLWRSQNPSEPLCRFPLNMEPNILNPDVLLARYPTSSYAGWVIKDIHSGATLGYANAEDMLDDLHRPFRERAGRAGHGEYDAEGESAWITPKEEAERYISLAKPFLKRHEDHALVPIISRRLALAYLVLHEWQQGYEAMKRSLSMPWPVPCFSRNPLCGPPTKDGQERGRDLAVEIVDALERKGLVEDED